MNVLRRANLCATRRVDVFVPDFGIAYEVHEHATTTVTAPDAQMFDEQVDTEPVA